MNEFSLYICGSGVFAPLFILPIAIFVWNDLKCEKKKTNILAIFAYSLKRWAAGYMSRCKRSSWARGRFHWANKCTEMLHVPIISFLQIQLTLSRNRLGFRYISLIHTCAHVRFPADALTHLFHWKVAGRRWKRLISDRWSLMRLANFVLRENFISCALRVHARVLKRREREGEIAFVWHHYHSRATIIHCELKQPHFTPH